MDEKVTISIIIVLVVIFFMFGFIEDNVIEGDLEVHGNLTTGTKEVQTIGGYTGNCTNLTLEVLNGQVIGCS
jgi:hypothetical protein